MTATPALAQSFDHSVGTGNLNAWPYAGTTNSIQSQQAYRMHRGAPHHAYAQEPLGAFSAMSPYPTYVPATPFPQYDGQGNLIVPSRILPGR
jgi:hypothetical protein